MDEVEVAGMEDRDGAVRPDAAGFDSAGLAGAAGCDDCTKERGRKSELGGLRMLLGVAMDFRCISLEPAGGTGEEGGPTGCLGSTLFSGVVDLAGIGDVLADIDARWLAGLGCRDPEGESSESKSLSLEGFAGEIAVFVSIADIPVGALGTLLKRDGDLLGSIARRLGTGYLKDMIRSKSPSSSSRSSASKMSSGLALAMIKSYVVFGPALRCGPACRSRKDTSWNQSSLRGSSPTSAWNTRSESSWLASYIACDNSSLPAARDCLCSQYFPMPKCCRYEMPSDGLPLSKGVLSRAA